MIVTVYRAEVHHGTVQRMLNVILDFAIIELTDTTHHHHHTHWQLTRRTRVIHVIEGRNGKNKRDRDRDPDWAKG